MKTLHRIGIGLAFVVFTLAAAYFWRNQESIRLDDVLAAPSQETFLQTDKGPIHYEMAGPADGPAVVLIHGVSGPMKVWDKTFIALRDAGFRVVRYDLFGRGLSARPKAKYDLPFYFSQLETLIRDLRLRMPLTLIGSSMGSVIASHYRNGSASQVSKLVFVGPAGFPLEATPARKLMTAPVLGGYLMATFGDTVLAGHNRRYFVEPDKFPEMLEAFQGQLKIIGTKRAILSTMRHTPVQNALVHFEQVGASAIPVLVVWGKQDVTFPFSNSEKLTKAVPQAKLIPVENAAHLPQYETPDITNRAILEFLR